MNKKKIKSRTDWKKVDALKDNQIDYSDIPELSEEFFKNATLRMPMHKSIITLRIDDDVVEWFKSKGKGYQTRINQLLRKYMEAHGGSKV